uniref:Uncharacterized protein n=1 Tax=Ananas comosus var. bracteatus TaxID=296719 RepID=A0A6V7P9U3_ANACO|nr:unnamed protein product [Ananas comosus var. bracteatus]
MNGCALSSFSPKSQLDCRFLHLHLAAPAAGGAEAAAPPEHGERVLRLAKAFAAGVILATGFVHMLHDVEAALTDPCLLRFPWRCFIFSGFVAMAAALATLVLDFLATQFYERKHRAPSPRRRWSHPWTRTRTRTRAPPRAATWCTSSGCARTRRRTATAPRPRARACARGRDEGQVSSHVRHIVAPKCSI